MATLFVDATTDYRNNLPFGNITDLTFTNDDAVAFARFDRSQFQPGLVSNTLHVTGSGPLTNVVHVYMQVANGAFSAAGWTFSDWGPEDYALFSGTTGNDTITGSSGADNIANGGGTDELHGGGGADILQINAQPLAGSLLDGGSQLIGTRDMLNIFVLGTTDLRQTTITSVEELGFVRDDQVFVLAGNQIGFGAIGTVANHFMDNLTLSVRGDSIDLRTVTFTGWTASCTVELRGTALADALYGSSQNDRLNGLASGADTLAGGAGNDTYVNPTGDTVVETANGGVDTVQSAVAFSLNALPEVERLFLTGNNNVGGNGNGRDNFMSGNTGNNYLRGFGGADTLQGGAGADTLAGGAGNDTLQPGGGFDLVVLGPGSGDDLVLGFETARDGFELPDGAFTSLQEIAGDTKLFYAGGTVTVDGIVGLSLQQWNDLIITN